MIMQDERDPEHMVDKGATSLACQERVYETAIGYDSDNEQDITQYRVRQTLGITGEL